MWHDSGVLDVALTADGRMIATGSHDATARLWDASTGEQIGQPMQHDDDVCIVQFSRDGKTLLTGSDDNSARLWHVSTCQLRGQPILHRGSAQAIALSPDGQTVVTVGHEDEVTTWTVPTWLRHHRERDLLSLEVQVHTTLVSDANGLVRRLRHDEWIDKCRRLDAAEGQPEQ
jgi:hypothetical protein